MFEKWKRKSKKKWSGKQKIESPVIPVASDVWFHFSSLKWATICIKCAADFRFKGLSKLLPVICMCMCGKCYNPFTFGMIVQFLSLLNSFALMVTSRIDMNRNVQCCQQKDWKERRRRNKKLVFVPSNKQDNSFTWIWLNISSTTTEKIWLQITFFYSQRIFQEIDVMFVNSFQTKLYWKEFFFFWIGKKIDLVDCFIVCNPFTSIFILNHCFDAQFFSQTYRKFFISLYIALKIAQHNYERLKQNKD